MNEMSSACSQELGPVGVIRTYAFPFQKEILIVFHIQRFDLAFA